jgi:SRSO17 transposase
MPAGWSCYGPIRRPLRMMRGVLVIDDSGDRKDGTKTAHAGHQWLGRYGKTNNGVVTVTTLWADERLYYPDYPVHAAP